MRTGCHPPLALISAPKRAWGPSNVDQAAILRVRSRTAKAVRQTKHLPAFPRRPPRAHSARKMQRANKRRRPTESTMAARPRTAEPEHGAGPILHVRGPLNCRPHRNPRRRPSASHRVRRVSRHGHKPEPAVVRRRPSTPQVRWASLGLWAPRRDPPVPRSRNPPAGDDTRRNYRHSVTAPPGARSRSSAARPRQTRALVVPTRKRTRACQGGIESVTFLPSQRTRPMRAISPSLSASIVPGTAPICPRASSTARADPSTHRARNARCFLEVHTRSGPLVLLCRRRLVRSAHCRPAPSLRPPSRNPSAHAGARLLARRRQQLPSEPGSRSGEHRPEAIARPTIRRRAGNVARAPSA